MGEVVLSDKDAFGIVETVLSFSKVYFAAFRVPRHRLRFWRFLLLVLRIERENPGKPIRGNFSRTEIKAVLGDTASPDNVRHWREALVDHFCEPGGPLFLNTELAYSPESTAIWNASESIVQGHRGRGRPSKPKFYTFSEAFNPPAAKYMEGLLGGVLKEPVLANKFWELSQDRRTEIFKATIGFIEQDYYPLWGHFVAEASKAFGRVGQSKRFKSAFNDRAPYGVIVLLTWKQMLQNLIPPLTERNYLHDVAEALREEEQTEIETALKTLIEWKVLHRTETGGHRLNEALDQPLRNYMVEVRSAQNRLLNFLQSAIG
jgi:hypothetical protein